MDVNEEFKFCFCENSKKIGGGGARAGGGGGRVGGGGSGWM